MSRRHGFWSIYSIRPDGGAEIRIEDVATVDVADEIAPLDHLGQPAWSPDGTRIAFTALVSGISEIFVMEADGSNREQLTESIDPSDIFPTWSPDGRQIAYSSIETDNLDICLMEADGSNKRCLTQASADEASPSWSPEGDVIAFTSARDIYEIHLIRVDGSGETNLTHDGLGWLLRLVA